MGSALGAAKIAAKRIGISFADYSAMLMLGQKWCTYGKHWASRACFPPDSHRHSGTSANCFDCRQEFRKKLTRKKKPRYCRGPQKEKASHAVNRAIAKGILAHPRTLPCNECGHLGNDRRHEYHHHRGYDEASLLDVIPLCSTCHKIETRKEKGLLTFIPPRALA